MFAPAGTPFYPAPHALGSRNWTNGERQVLTTIGEVDAPSVRPYRKGSLPIAFPPAIQLGAGGCLSGQSAAPAPAGSMPLVYGFPAACWANAGLVAPPPGPILWLRPDELQTYANGTPITDWPDASAYGHDGRQYGAGQPAPDVQGALVADALCGNSTVMASLEPVTLPGDYAIYAVAKVVQSGLLTSTLTILGSSSSNSYPLRVLSNAAQYRQAPAPAVVQPLPFTFNVLALYSVRRRGTQLLFRYNGTVYGAQQTAAPLTMSSTSVVPAFFSTHPAVTSNLYELRVYSGTMDDVTDAGIVGALNQRYTIF